jgi:hypothetical protein
MSMKTFKIAFILTILVICSPTLMISQENDFISRLKTQLLLYRTQKIDQTAIVLTDKTLYRPGESIWMKCYVTDAITHLLSLNSLEYSILLTNSKGANIAEGKYLLKNGVAECCFTIPEYLQSDIYYLIAYTPEMENLGVRSVFKKEIFIGKPEQLGLIPHIEFSKPFFESESKETATLNLKDLNGKPLSGKKFEYQIIKDKRELLTGKGKTGVNGTGEIVFLTPSAKDGSPMMISLDVSVGNDQLNMISKIPLASEKINITFFPSGGNLVPGISQIVIYEATDQLGKPVNINADIIDNQGKFIATTSTIRPGLGIISLLINNSDPLKLRITSDIGKGQETSFPSLSPKGMSLSVKKNDGKNLTLLLGRSPDSELSNFKIVAVSNGEMIWASDFELKQTGILNIPLDNFQSEVASIAIFNDTGALIAQRVIYIGKKQLYTIDLSANKSQYKKGEEGEIKIKVIDLNGKPVKAELAVSLSDQYAFPDSVSGTNILSYGLEKPLPFNDSPDKTNRMVDYSLAANKLKGFDWSEVLAIDPSKTTHVGNVGTRITGKVVDAKNLPVPNAFVTLTRGSLQQFNTRSDQHGEFLINLPVSVEKKNLSVSATDGSGKGNYHVVLNENFRDELISSLNNTSTKEMQLLEQLFESNYFKNNPDFLKATSSTKTNGKSNRENMLKNSLDGSRSILEVIKGIRPFEYSRSGKIIFRGMNSLTAQDGALIVIDDIKMGTDASVLSSINPSDVIDIQVLIDPIDMARYSALNSVGIIVVSTRRGKEKDGSSTTEDSRTASAQKYFIPETIGNEKYQLKTTLQWIPVVFTDENGEATIHFKTGNINSTFILKITGFTDQGQWIENQTEIKVE